MNIVSIDLKSINRTSSGAITGRICFNLKGIKFPDKNWDDFIVVVLLWWLEEVHKVSKTYEFDFMDGPFCVRGNHIDSSNVKLEFVEQRVSNEIVELTDIVDYSALKNSIVVASKTLVNTCLQKKYSNDDLLRLEKRLLKLNC